MGVSDQVGGIVHSITEGLKTNPSCLAAICLAAIFAVLTFYALQNDQERQHERFQMLFNVCFVNPISQPTNRAPGQIPLRRPTLEKK